MNNPLELFVSPWAADPSPDKEGLAPAPTAAPEWLPEHRSRSSPLFPSLPIFSLLTYNTICVGLAQLPPTYLLPVPTLLSESVSMYPSHVEE
jgi:hypothetical protein